MILYDTDPPTRVLFCRISVGIIRCYKFILCPRSGYVKPDHKDLFWL